MARPQGPSTGFLERWRPRFRCRSQYFWSPTAFLEHRHFLPSVRRHLPGSESAFPHVPPWNDPISSAATVDKQEQRFQIPTEVNSSRRRRRKMYTTALFHSPCSLTTCRGSKRSSGEGRESNWAKWIAWYSGICINVIVHQGLVLELHQLRGSEAALRVDTQSTKMQACNRKERFEMEDKTSNTFDELPAVTLNESNPKAGDYVLYFTCMSGVRGSWQSTITCKQQRLRL